jgi:ribulose-bisphosphate carboxylase large chain
MARFTVTYWLGAQDEPEARARALELAAEQTVEIPRDIVPAGYVEDEILGQLVGLECNGDSRGGYLATISYSDDDVGEDFLQLLNIVFGNSSLKTQTRVETLTLSDGIRSLCRGPKHGTSGIRRCTGVPAGPIMLSAVKPVGLSTAALAALAHQFALGGMNLIKDDHGLVNQPASRFQDRVKACVDAVNDANAKTGLGSAFVPNITCSAAALLDRARLAQELGAGAVMVAPALLGFDAVRTLAADPDFHLPILSHPSFAGTNVITPTTGFSHHFFFGLLQRLMGVDSVIFPNFGGRFGFSREECLAIKDGCTAGFGDYKPVLPACGGGMSLERIPDMRATYGRDVIYLIGGALLRDKGDLVGACQRLVDAVRAA